VMITGTNLTGATAVKIGTIAVTGVTVVSDTQITLIVPPTAVSAKISVTTPGGTATSVGTFLMTKVTSFSPASGAMGATVTITGTNLTGATDVQFNGVSSGTPVSVTATTVKALVPAMELMDLKGGFPLLPGQAVPVQLLHEHKDGYALVSYLRAYRRIAATHDIGFEKDQRNGKVTHKIDPAVDGERDNIGASLEKAGKVKSMYYYLPPNPVQDARNATGGGYHSDGRILVLVLQ